MRRFTLTPDQRTQVRGLLYVALVALIAICSSQLALHIPTSYALTLAWCTLGLALVTLVALMWVRWLIWIVLGLFLVFGEGLLYAGIMARYQLLGHLCIGVAAIILVGVAQAGCHSARATSGMRK